MHKELTGKDSVGYTFLGKRQTHLWDFCCSRTSGSNTEKMGKSNAYLKKTESCVKITHNLSSSDI